MQLLTGYVHKGKQALSIAIFVAVRGPPDLQEKILLCNFELPFLSSTTTPDPYSKAGGAALKSHLFVRLPIVQTINRVRNSDDFAYRNGTSTNQGTRTF